MPQFPEHLGTQKQKPTLHACCYSRGCETVRLFCRHWDQQADEQGLPDFDRVVSAILWSCLELSLVLTCCVLYAPVWDAVCVSGGGSGEPWEAGSELRALCSSLLPSADRLHLLFPPSLPTSPFSCQAGSKLLKRNSFAGDLTLGPVRRKRKGQASQIVMNDDFSSSVDSPLK